MSSQDGYVKSGVGGSTVRIVWPRDGTSEIDFWSIAIFYQFFFFVGGTCVELRSGEASARRQQAEYVEDDQNVD